MAPRGYPGAARAAAKAARPRTNPLADGYPGATRAAARGLDRGPAPPRDGYPGAARAAAGAAAGRISPSPAAHSSVRRSVSCTGV